MHTFTVFACGLFPEYRSEDHNGIIRLRVIDSWTETTDVEWEFIEEWANMHIKVDDVMALVFLLLRNEETGAKHFLKQRDLGKDGIRDGHWEWVPFQFKVDRTVLLVHDHDTCPRCGGKGEVSYGNVTVNTKHGISRRTCFGCGGYGVSPFVPKKED